jgi:hypothetical protein
MRHTPKRPRAASGDREPRDSMVDASTFVRAQADANHADLGEVFRVLAARETARRRRSKRTKPGDRQCSEDTPQTLDVCSTPNTAPSPSAVVRFNQLLSLIRTESAQRTQPPTPKAGRGGCRTFR